MDRRTLLAIGLSMAVVLVWSIFFLPKPEEVVPIPAEQSERPLLESSEFAAGGVFAPFANPLAVADPNAGVLSRTINKQTDLFDILFDAEGGTITSLRLREHTDVSGELVDLVHRPGEDRLFQVIFGDYQTQPVDDAFSFADVDDHTWAFARTFLATDGAPFTLTKTYSFAPGSYLFQVSIEIDNSVNEFPALDFAGTGYTLAVAPQIGPGFGQLGGGGLAGGRSSELREFWNFANGKEGRQNFPRRETIVQENKHVTWTAIVGKYFALVTEPAVAFDQITYDSRPDPVIERRSALFFSRPPLSSSRNIDTFRVYAGPRIRSEMSRYNDSDPFGGGGHEFERALSSRPLIGWLANVLRFFLDLFYRLIPNYGVAIILLTIFIKALLFPLTKKSMESTAKMSGLSPKIDELKQKHKGNSQKLNQEMAGLYKKEGVNPIGGCLPLLLQMPIFFALFDLLSTAFDLRGAAFIAPWIADLSSPETVLSQPLFGTVELRILPFVMSGTQLLQTRLTQNTQSSQAQMKIMMYAMPIVFFFILYGMPSGLVIYWTMQNLLSIAQQAYFNDKRKRDAAGGDGEGDSSGGRKGRPRSK